MGLDPDAIQARCEDLVGQVLGGRYRLDAVLGMGAMGAVFRARHTGLERDVALKLLHQDLMASDEMRARFAREAAAISKLDHPNCVRVSDFGSDGDHQYLVMELLQGTPLGDLLDEQPLPLQQATDVIDDVLAGLEHAHGHGLVHRDIKPDNIFMAQDDGGVSRAKLLDFGIVKLQEQEGARQLTQVGMIFGTPCYMSPEQATGATVDARTDLYSVGIILHLLLAGRLPFDSDDALKVLRQQIRDPPPPLPADVPEPIRAVVGTLLAKQPDERYPSAAAAREALARAREPEPVAPPIPTAVVVDAPAPVSIPAPVTPPVPAGPVLAGPVPAGPVMVVPSRARPWWPPAWWPLGLDVRWVAGGLGALVIVVLLVLVTGDDDDAQAPAADPTASAAREELTKLLGGEPGPTKREDGEAKAPAAANANPDATPPEPEPGADASARTLRATLVSIDALIAAREHEAARITLGPLLAAHPDDAQLHWRMAQVLTAIGGAANRAAALDSHAAAIRADASLLDDEAFTQQLWASMDDPALRAPAVELALEHLGSRADDRLLQWLNVQQKPLDQRARHRVITHLQAAGRGDGINQPLQRAFDLWQARDAEDPCEAFSAALRAAQEHPDSFLVGTLHAVAVPATKAAAEAAPQACPGAAEQLAEVRSRYDEMFVGIDPVVPKAYRKRPAKPSQGSRKQRRR